MRNMSFAMTTSQIKQRTKTVTRRLGWSQAKPGDLICAVKKCMGLQPGQQVERLAILVVTDVRKEPLNAITDADVIAEGFPGLTRSEFVEMFLDNLDCQFDHIVTRIEFRYVPGGRFIDRKHLSIIKHMVGDDGRCRKSSIGFRNHYCAEIGYDDHKTLTTMAGLNLVRPCNIINQGRDQYFQATEFGLKQAGYSAAVIKRAME